MRMKRLRAFLFVSAFLLFLLLMDYPYLSRLYNDRISGEVIAVWEKSEADADCERRLLQAADYNRNLALRGDPSGWMAAARVLCPDASGVAGWIRIPSLDVLLPLYIGTGEEALNEGAGILEGSSLPVGGPSTHTCISAHRGLPDRTLFTNLDLLRPGGRVEVHTLSRTLVYQVFDDETVLPSNTAPLKILKGEDLLTLITCTPYGINTHRLYVHARRVADDGKGSGSLPDAASCLERLLSPVFWKQWWWAFATAVLLLFLILLVRRSWRGAR